MLTFQRTGVPLAVTLALAALISGPVPAAGPALAQMYPSQTRPSQYERRRPERPERPSRPRPSRPPPGYYPPPYYPPAGVVIVPAPPPGGYYRPPPPGFYPVDPEPPPQPRRPRRRQPAGAQPASAQPAKPAPATSRPAAPQPPRTTAPVPPPPPGVLPPPRSLLAQEVPHVPDEVLYVLRPDVPQSQAQAVADDFQLTLLETTPLALIGVSVARARVPQGQQAAAVLLALAGDPRVDSAQLNHLFEAQRDVAAGGDAAAGEAAEAGDKPADDKPADKTAEKPPEKQPPEKPAEKPANTAADKPVEKPVGKPAGGTADMASAQYAPDRLNVPRSHALATGRDVRIAVIDSGVEIGHPEIAAGLLAASTARKPSAHGTAVAGIIAARARMIGVAPESRILAIDAFADSDGREVGSTLDILRAFEQAAKHDVHITNLSFAGPSDDLLARALRSLALRGVVLVAAAGNGGADAPPPYPAAHPDVLGVTAVDSAGALYEKATPGPHVAIAAPGVEVLAPTVDSGYQVISGTSMAAAHVAGIAALLLQADPELTPEALRELLLATARDAGPPGYDESYGAGEADALAAVEKAAKPAPDQQRHEAKEPDERQDVSDRAP